VDGILLSAKAGEKNLSIVGKRHPMRSVTEKFEDEKTVRPQFFRQHYTFARHEKPLPLCERGW